MGQEELLDFYLPVSSVLQVDDTEPSQKVAALIAAFDADGDGCLCFSEASSLWAITGEDVHEPLNEVTYQELCAQIGACPNRGLHEDGLSQLCEMGIIDLDVYFSALHQQPQWTDIGEQVEDDEQVNEILSEVDDTAMHVYECENEDEFEEMVEGLGLERLKRDFDASGRLQLPGGKTAASKTTSLARRDKESPAFKPHHKGEIPSIKELLCRGTTGELQIALQRRKDFFEQEKQVLAVLRKDNKRRIRLGVDVNKSKRIPPRKAQAKLLDPYRSAWNAS